MFARFGPPSLPRGVFNVAKNSPRTYTPTRLLTTAPPSAPRPFLHRTRVFARYSAYLFGSTVVGLGVVTGAIFVHDAFTYTDKHVDRVPVSPLALHPERGGPKNLPVVSAFLGDEEDEKNIAIGKKPRLVIVGGGWGVSIIRSSTVQHLLTAFLVCWCTGKTFFGRLSCNGYWNGHFHYVYTLTAL